MELNKITQEELNEIIKLHNMWLRSEEGGKRANLSYADLSGLNLFAARLACACLEGANLKHAVLHGADLRLANLRNANLYAATLRKADLSKADLSEADLSEADLSDATLSYADLSNAAMCHATLHNTDLHRSNLYMADLSKANLTIANLRHVCLIAANLDGATLDDSEKIRLGIILTEPMVGWKKCKYNIIVRLEIPAGSIVYSINNSKCRTNHAVVKEIIGDTIACSAYDPTFKYKVGDDIIIKDFNLRYNAECSTGIHFFRTKEEAEDYIF